MTDRNPDDQIESDASSGAVSRKSGVRRVNNRPIYILAGVLGTFLLAMVLVAADRAAEQDAPAEAPKEKGGNTKIFAEVIAGDYVDGMIEPAKPLVEPVPVAPPPPAEPPVLVVRPPVLMDEPPAPPRNSDEPKRDREELARTQKELRHLQDQLARLQDQMKRPQNTEQQDMEALRIHDAKLELLQQAVAAKSGVAFSAPRSVGSSSSLDTIRGDGSAIGLLENVDAFRGDPEAVYRSRLAQLKALGRLGGEGGAASGTGRSLQFRTDAGPGGAGDTGLDFNGTGGDGKWQLDNQLEAPTSPYELRAGFVVPGTLISGINSDLPGTIMAQVSQNVYDTATGRHLLIPQGSRLVGTYSSDVAFGQSRVLVAWQRIVFPDGKALDIESMPGADGAGYAGFHDQVNNHYIRVFASALLMSGITASISFSQGQNDSGGDSDEKPTVSDELTRALGQQLGEVSAQMIEKNLNIAPTLEIRPGYRFNIIVVKDMTFPKPYQAFDY